MLFETQVKRQRWAQYGVALAMDVVVAWGITKYLLHEDADTGVLVYLALQALGIARAIIYSLGNWALYLLGGKRVGIAAFRTMLQQAKLPAAGAYETSASNYLHVVADDGDVPTETRVGAAWMGGWLTGLKATSGMWEAVRLEATLEEAVKEHSLLSGRIAATDN